MESHIYLDKIKEDLHSKNKNNEIEWYKSKSKRNSDFSSHYNLHYNNSAITNNNCDVNIMPVNNFKSIFKSFNFKK